jgi:hypothetical protein
MSIYVGKHFIFRGTAQQRVDLNLSVFICALVYSTPIENEEALQQPIF